MDIIEGSGFFFLNDFDHFLDLICGIHGESFLFDKIRVKFVEIGKRFIHEMIVKKLCIFAFANQI